MPARAVHVAEMVNAHRTSVRAVEASSAGATLWWRRLRLEQVQRTALHLLEDACEILSDQSDEDQLKSAEDERHTDQRGVARHQPAEEVAVQQRPGEIHKTGNGDDAAGAECEPQWFGGKREYRVQRQRQHLHETVLCASLGAVWRNVRYECALVSHPRDQTSEEPMPLRHVAQRFVDAARQETEIRRAFRDLGL